MQITVPVDDSTPVDEPPGRYFARVGGEVVWQSHTQVDCLYMAATIRLMTGDAVYVDHVEYGNITRLSGGDHG